MAKPVTRRFGKMRHLPSGRWQASYVGPDRQRHLAPRTFKAKADGEAWLRDRQKEILLDIWEMPTPADEPDGSAPGVTFATYADRWLANRMIKGRPIRPRTRQHYSQLLDTHLLPTFGKRPIATITMSQVDRWYASTATDTPTVRAHAYSLLRTILETARVRDRLIESNPCAITGAGTATRKSKTRPATLDELTTMVEEMPDRFRAMMMLACWGALRFGELVELRRKDIGLTQRVERDEEGQEVTVREGVVRVERAAVRVDKGWQVGDPKSDAGRREVAIPPHIVPVVEHHLAEHVGAERESLLFPADHGGHLQPSTLYRHWYRARAKAKRDDLRWHDLRHTGAVLAAMTGATLAELMSRLGHSTPGAAMRYQHAAQGRDRQIADALSRLAIGS
ncbi:integrase [Mycolicibacterium elephantis]|uniref:tyrosine-type recombinase/integrase n=1 Tax=Mycolicibacterium elephantis TaxID=81858 RepID=UPI0007EA566D|nr:site-specific integrase [Mycolicibacterium elephantis]OBA65742.1 integrase [Mycolicibacterium elephantis]